MKQFLRTLSATAFLTLTMGLSSAYAQKGQPHSVSAKAVFDQVTLNWKKPAESIKLQWHNDYAYNGADGVLTDPEGSVTIYGGAKFSAADLTNYVGQVVDSIYFYEYRPVYQAEALVYENGKVVQSTPVDLSNFKKNSWRHVALPKGYTIKAGTDVIFAVKLVYGRNCTLTFNCDKTVTPGKGNLYSYDGKSWKTDGPGDFLITAIVHNDATAQPTGYNVYRNDTKLNAEPVDASATSYVANSEPTGTYAYKVAAIYADGEKASYGVNASPRSAYDMIAPVSYAKVATSGVSNTLTWTDPLKRSTEMTWSNKKVGTAIGGTAASDTKVWAKQEFSAEDMAAFPNHQIKAINAYVGPEGGITGVTIWVMKNGKIAYYEEMSADVVSAIKNGDWNKFALSTPYKMELGSSYAFGVYYTQEAKKHPVGVDTSAGLVGKGNEFSTSSPNSKGFDQTRLSWKTLSSGKIAGNFMLTADVEALSEEAKADQPVASSFNIYRNGELVAEGVQAYSYEDKVPELGRYEYSIVGRSADGKASPAYEVSATVALPSEYAAPIVIGKSQEGKNVKLEWSSNAYEMKHYDRATTAAGFPESMSVLYGAKFTKEELKPYVGYKFYSMKFGIYAKIGTFKVEVRDNDNNVLLTRTYTEDDIEPGYVYNTTFDDGETFTIPADKDLYLCYNATLPAGVSAILFDNGPAVAGGAMISVTGGSSWLNFGTLAPAVKDHNVVIGGMAVENVGGQQGVKAKAAKFTAESINNALIERREVGTVKLGAIEMSENEGLGIEADRPMRAADDATAEKPQAKAFRLYHNGEMIYEGTKTSYEGTLDKYGEHQYYVTTVYANGWESPASSVAEFSNVISQKGEAPYDLKATTDGSTLNLTWAAGSGAPELTYQHDGGDMVLGMTGTSAPEGYHVIKFKAAEMADKVGQRVSRIKFKLADAKLTSASVIVMYGFNIMYEQTIPVSDLVAGWNTVVLNDPVEIVAGQDISVGYHITYSAGLKPIVLDDQPAVSGYSDLISSSADPSYWYSLATKYKTNYNYRISAFLEKGSVELQPQKAQRALAKAGYNVYCDGVKVNKSTVTSTSYSIANAPYGVYTVTAVDLKSESSESNKVVYSETTAITLPTAATATDGKTYSIDGRMVSPDANTTGLQQGVYVRNGKKIVVK